ncbi:hypothetical protein [Xanthobacter tagetidis]|jgi:hypothetical protein|uniref:ABC-type transport auxiliary lipoprotein component domain-containing protein n=1 Tax=Xanthobacter tagetidis TaxID=60216 RepID=A0A3L7AJJ8_9HYPH|nr:hypothetical protein [Xanthobacter tagetidis]MBB6309094.1 hypothetical protein [Xanthobacter tagetidis]RLP80417.1 hypothetical protein D9R14_04975 [Xanthobacter tagetidis]
MTKGLDIVFQSLDSEYVLARVIWREQDSGGGTVTLEIPVRNSAAAPKSTEQLKADARALAIRFARAFADTIQD